MIKLLFLTFFTLLFSCKKEQNRNSTAVDFFNIKLENAISKQDSIAYFENALVYQVEQNNKKEEFWIYVNEKEKQLLFIPHDDMIRAVISYPDGIYKLFGTNENGDKIVLKQIVPRILHKNMNEDMLEETNEIKIINQKNIQQKNIICEGFRATNRNMQSGETVYATTQIPISSFQLYGFSQLEGDAKLPINFQDLDMFRKEQVITHLERGNCKVELRNYGPNPYEFDLKK